MINYNTTAELKGEAREALLGKYGTVIGACIIVASIEYIISSMVSQIIGGNALFLFIVSEIVAIILELLFGILQSGIAYMYLNVIYKQPVNVTDVFYGFKENSQKAVCLQAIFTVGDIILTIGTAILTYCVLYLGSFPQKVVYTGIAFSVVGLIVSIMIRLTYSQVFFILNDFPNKSVPEIISLSVQLMKGNKLRLFKLYLSFIPYYLLGIVALFIPLLWVSVYKDCSVAAFYQNLIATASANRQHNGTVNTATT